MTPVVPYIATERCHLVYDTVRVFHAHRTKLDTERNHLAEQLLHDARFRGRCYIPILIDATKQRITHGAANAPCLMTRVLQLAHDRHNHVWRSERTRISQPGVYPQRTLPPF